MPFTNLQQLCRQISEEKDPEKLTKAIADLAELLRDEQNVIRAEIRQNLSKMICEPW